MILLSVLCWVDGIRFGDSVSGMSKPTPSIEEISLNILTNIKDSIIYATGAETPEELETHDELFDEMVDGFIETAEIEILAWSPTSEKLLVAIGFQEPSEFYA